MKLAPALLYDPVWDEEHLPVTMDDIHELTARNWGRGPSNEFCEPLVTYGLGGQLEPETAHALEERLAMEARDKAWALTLRDLLRRNRGEGAAL